MRVSWHNRSLGTLITVAMVMRKPSKSMNIALILTIFARYGCLIYINVHAKNEENLPSRFWDRPHSNSTATRFRLRIWRFSDIMDDVIAHVTSRDFFVMSCNVFLTSHNVFVKSPRLGPTKNYVQVGGGDRVSNNEKRDMESIILLQFEKSHLGIQVWLIILFILYKSRHF